MMFSLVIPMYDEENNVERVATGVIRELERVSSSDANAFEIEVILVDNGSRDGTGSIAARLAARDRRIRVVTVESNEGFGNGVLVGLHSGSGDLLGFMA